MVEKLSSFDPVLPEEPKVLILGSMPSRLSFEHAQYYGNPRNHFWAIMFELFKQPPMSNYEEKIAFIKGHGIALWDTIGSCYRKGSLDMHISDEEPNDVIGLLNTYQTIRLVACNGTKSFQTFKKHVIVDENMDVDVIKLPSTSPIPGRYTKTLEGKTEDWKQILYYL